MGEKTAAPSVHRHFLALAVPNCFVLQRAADTQGASPLPTWHLTSLWLQTVTARALTLLRIVTLVLLKILPQCQDVVGLQ
jgi:hypothetical protein